MADKKFDESSMRPALNATDEAIKEIQRAIAKLQGISYGNLAGAAKETMVQKINGQIDILKQGEKRLIASRDTIARKIKALQ